MAAMWSTWQPRSMTWREAAERRKRATRAWRAKATLQSYRRWCGEWAQGVMLVHEARQIGNETLVARALRCWQHRLSVQLGLTSLTALASLVCMWRRWHVLQAQRRSALDLLHRLWSFFAGWRLMRALFGASTRERRGRLLDQVADARRHAWRLKARKHGWKQWRANHADLLARAQDSARIGMSFALLSVYASLAVRRGWRAWRASVHGRMQHIKLRETSRRFERTRRRIHMAGSLGAWNAISSMCETERIFLQTKSETVGDAAAPPMHIHMHMHMHIHRHMHRHMHMHMHMHLEAMPWPLPSLSVLARTPTT